MAAPMLSMIYAADEAGLIGLDDDLPWVLATDQNRFRSITMGHVVVAGSKTFDATGELDGRHMIVLTSKWKARSSSNRGKPVRFVGTIEGVKRMARELIDQNNLPNEVIIIGGAATFRAFETQTIGRIYETTVLGPLKAPTGAGRRYRFTRAPGEWMAHEAGLYPADDFNERPHLYIRWDRIKAT